MQGLHHNVIAKVIGGFLALFPGISMAEPVSYLIWGSFCGECAEHCSTLYKATPETVEIDRSDAFLQTDYSAYQFSGVPLTTVDKTHYSWIFNTQWPVLENRLTVIGEPDAYDQCGLFLSYELKGVVYKVLIDPASESAQFQPLLNKLFKGM